MKFDLPERVLQDIVKAAKKQGGGTHQADYKKSRTEKGYSRDLEERFCRNFILAKPKALYASTKTDKTAYNVSIFLEKHRLHRRNTGM